MKKIATIFISVSLIACSGNTPIEETIIGDSDSAVHPLSEMRAERAKEIFKTLPTPVETAELFYISGTVYNPAITNLIGNINNYTTSTKKALNLGVYGGDLSYSNVFDQTEQSMKYVNCTQRMADAIEVTSAFNEEIVARLEENMNNRDSLMVIIHESFGIIDTHLKENGRDHLSALVIVGGWIEGLYLGASFLDKENLNTELIKKIAVQKESLESLIDLLMAYNNDDIKALNEDLNTLHIAYAKIDQEAIDPSIVFEIQSIVNEIRSKIVS